MEKSYKHSFETLKTNAAEIKFCIHFQISITNAA